MSRSNCTFLACKNNVEVTFGTLFSFCTFDELSSQKTKKRETSVSTKILNGRRAPSSHFLWCQPLTSCCGNKQDQARNADVNKRCHYVSHSLVKRGKKNLYPQKLGRWNNSFTWQINKISYTKPNRLNWLATCKRIQQLVNFILVSKSISTYTVKCKYFLEIFRANDFGPRNNQWDSATSFDINITSILFVLHIMNA